MPTPLDFIKKRRETAVENLKNKGYFSKRRVYIGMATCEIAAGSKDVMEAFKKAEESGLIDIYLSQKGCAGRCNLEPTVEIIEEGKPPSKYIKVTEEKAKTIIINHIINGQEVSEWLAE